MVISHKYRYLFIELPLTASTAIAKELCENYDGQEIHYKHANYRTFLKSASDDEKKYFTFIGIRNPLDQVVSYYYKYLNNHKGKYSNPQPRKSKMFKYWLNERKHRARFQFIHLRDADFEKYFLEFYKTPYLDWSLLDSDRMDGVIRFEQVQDDFAQVLQQIGVEMVRPLPQVNKTKQKSKSFWDHYATKESQIRAAEVFGPYMKKWGYEFPNEWEAEPHLEQMRGKFERELKFKKLYWNLMG